jgi:hypothetical protein
MMPGFHIALFGAFRIRDGNTSIVTITQARQQALLVYLLLHRTAPQSRAQKRSVPTNRHWPWPVSSRPKCWSCEPA